MHIRGTELEKDVTERIKARDHRATECTLCDRPTVEIIITDYEEWKGGWRVTYILGCQVCEHVFTEEMEVDNV